MASWTDGPEYAPTERPDVFVEPDLTGVGGLASARPPAPLPDAPDGRRDRPEFTGPDAAPLDAVVRPATPGRDPYEAFEVAATPMTSWSPAPLPPPEGEPVPLAPPPPPATPSAWGHAHAPGVPGRPPAAAPTRTPLAPFPAGEPPAPQHVPGPPSSWPPAQVNPDGFPQPGPPPWQQAAPTPHRTSEPVTLQAIARNATPGVLVCLAVGALINPFSLALLVVASVLAVRVRYRRRLVGRLFSWAMLGALTLGFIAHFAAQGFLDAISWYDRTTTFAQLADAVLLVLVPLVVGDAMRKGERPEEGM